MDEKILIYIILGIIYFLFNRLKKKSPEDEPEVNRPPDTTVSDRPKPMTFEELLREITEGKQPTQSPPPIDTPPPSYKRPVAQPEYVDYDDDLQEEEQSLEKASFDDDRATKIYEDAKKEAFYRPSLEETLKLADVDTSFGKFKEFELKAEPKILNEYAKDLRDPKGFKKAFILSEVLNRKHF